MTFENSEDILESSIFNMQTFEKIEDRKNAHNAPKNPLHAPKLCRKVRKEYGVVRLISDGIAREKKNFQEFRIFDRRFDFAMLKQCWSSDNRSSNLSKANYVAIEGCVEATHRCWRR